MDTADLDDPALTVSDCIPVSLVTRLLELGHEREVELQAGRGEWVCALEWSRLLGDRGQYDQALDVLGPYIATGWWPAARARADLLEGWGRAQEAIDLSRPYARAGDSLVLDFFARLLARHGRAAEAFALLRPGIEGWFLARALVDVAEAAGRDEEVAALLEARIEAAVPACDDPDCHRLRIEPSNAFALLATVRERQGRVDEAIAVMRALADSPNGAEDYVVDTLCTLYAEHGRAREALAYLDTLKERRGGEEEWDFFRIRLPLMAPPAACATKRSSRPGPTPKAAPGTRPGPSRTCLPRPAAAKKPSLSSNSTPIPPVLSSPTTSSTSAASRKPSELFRPDRAPPRPPTPRAPPTPPNHRSDAVPHPLVFCGHVPRSRPPTGRERLTGRRISSSLVATGLRMPHESCRRGEARWARTLLGTSGGCWTTPRRSEPGGTSRGRRRFWRSG
ncbi:hypothetical protein OG196_00725 [Kitasatospora purpeofusca]|uniref:tetratricopeptide repeat protein n=1 Tax=Kitasatospora purpeofusca TaxID=67352 RepID=UPI002E15A3D6|nr:hypothetical protein OG196_00725 [Kitasatospora purpeofusca]